MSLSHLGCDREALNLPMVADERKDGGVGGRGGGQLRMDGEDTQM